MCFIIGKPPVIIFSLLAKLVIQLSKLNHFSDKENVEFLNIHQFDLDVSFSFYFYLFLNFYYLLSIFAITFI